MQQVTSVGELLRESARKAPVVKKGDYDYVVHPLTDGVPQIDPQLLDEVVREIIRITDLNADKIVTAEAMGIPIGSVLSVRAGIPLSIIRKRSYGLPGEVSVAQVTGYSKGALFINGIERGDRIVFVDDVVSTGGTLAASLQALRKIGAEIVDVVVLFEKGEGRKRVERELGLTVKTLLAIEVVDGKVSLA